MAIAIWCVRYVLVAKRDSELASYRSWRLLGFNYTSVLGLIQQAIHRRDPPGWSPERESTSPLRHCI